MTLTTTNAVAERCRIAPRPTATNAATTKLPAAWPHAVASAVRRPCASARPTTNSTPGPGMTISTSDAMVKPSSCPADTMPSPGNEQFAAGRAQLGRRTHAEQLHGPPELFGQDVQRLVHPQLAAGHQAIQVGAPDGAGVRAERQRHRDVRTVPDARVDQHGYVRPDGRADGGDQIDRRHRPVELAPAVVGKLQAVRSGGNREPGVSGPERALDDQLARPARPQFGDVVPVDARVEQ